MGAQHRFSPNPFSPTSFHCISLPPLQLLPFQVTPPLLPRPSRNFARFLFSLPCGVIYYSLQRRERRSSSVASMWTRSPSEFCRRPRPIASPRPFPLYTSFIHSFIP